jgi:signal transduction histidine kinase
MRAEGTVLTGAKENAAPMWSGQVRAPSRLRLPQKTTVILAVLLTVVVAVVGGIFFFSTRSMLKSAQSAQVSSFAYGVAATLRDDGGTDGTVQIEFNALDKTPNLEFVVLTDTAGKQMAAFIADRTAWWDYRGLLEKAPNPGSRLLGQVQEVAHRGSGQSSYAVTVPVFRIGPRGERAGLYGYLHASFATEGMAAQLRILQAFMLLTSMVVVLLAVPIAGLIARHITVPIEQLASGAHALADGDLSHRVALQRGDELGELAGAFNRMADTVQQQQEAIRQINTGLEQTVQERTAELRKVNTRLHAEIAEKEDFMRAVSHDLNAPLRNIAGMASMLALKYADSLEKDALQRLDRIQKNVQVECELINELLELSRIKSRREKMERVDLHELVTVVSEGFANDLETRGITLTIGCRLPVMTCERMRMRQVFQNLLDNAIKYMRDEGPKEIAIGVKREDGDMVFTVADTGMGIAQEDMGQLFHVFRRAKNATMMKVPGKGVGLASVKSIVENYGGRLWAESVMGEGTTFYISIPMGHFARVGEEMDGQADRVSAEASNEVAA